MGRIYVCVFCLKKCVCEVLPARFSYYPRWVLLSVPVRSLLLGLTPENFLKFEVFPGESGRPHWGTEAGF